MEPRWAIGLASSGQNFNITATFSLIASIASCPVTMTDSRNPPLSYEDSATTTHQSVSTTLPPEVISCLKNSRFVSPTTTVVNSIQNLASN